MSLVSIDQGAFEDTQGQEIIFLFWRSYGDNQS